MHDTLGYVVRFAIGTAIIVWCGVLVAMGVKTIVDFWRD